MSLLDIIHQAQKGASKERRSLDKKLHKLQEKRTAVEMRQRMYNIIELRELLDASNDWRKIEDWTTLVKGLTCVVLFTNTHNPSYLAGEVHQYINGGGLGMSISSYNARQYTFRTHDGRIIPNEKERENVLIYTALTTPANYDGLGI